VPVERQQWTDALNRNGIDVPEQRELDALHF
jgi:hypothetical protein